MKHETAPSASAKLLRLAIALPASLLAACASTYKMPDLPQGGGAAIAVLEHEDKSPGAKFFINRIDDQPRGVGWIDRFELTPGRRSVTAGINPYGYRGGSITRCFAAEAGREYLFVVHDDIQAKRWNFSILEMPSRRKVDFACT